MGMQYPWYDVIDGQSLEQGDILENFSVFEPKPESEDVIEHLYNLIVMTQTCDVDEVSHIIFCPLWTRKELEKNIPDFFAQGRLGTLLKYHMIGWYPINKCELPGFVRPWRIVQFHRVLEIRKELVTQHLEKIESHLRLLPPFREALSQHFARFFMRVGLPDSVDVS